MRRARWVAVPALLLVTLACSEAADDRTTVAFVDGQALSYGELESWVLENVGERPSGLESSAMRALFATFLDEACVARRAVEEGLATELEPRDEAAARLLESLPPIVVGEEEVRDYYEREVAGVEHPERVVLGQILVPDRETAELVRDEIAAGGSFEEVGEAWSARGRAFFPGFLEEVGIDDLPAAFGEAVFALEPGEVTDLVEVESGFHLFQVRERLPAGVPSFEESREAARQVLRRRAEELRRSDVAREACERYNARPVEGNLPFEVHWVPTDDEAPSD